MCVRNESELKRSIFLSKPSGGWKKCSCLASPTILSLWYVVSFSLAWAGMGEGRHKKDFLWYSFAQLSCLSAQVQPYFFSTLELIIYLSPSLLFAPHPSFHLFLSPRLRGGGGGKKGCIGSGSLSLWGPGSTIKCRTQGWHFIFFLLVLPSSQAGPLFYFFLFFEFPGSLHACGKQQAFHWALMSFLWASQTHCYYCPVTNNFIVFCISCFLSKYTSWTLL